MILLDQLAWIHEILHNHGLRAVLSLESVDILVYYLSFMLYIIVNDFVIK